MSKQLIIEHIYRAAKARNLLDGRLLNDDYIKSQSKLLANWNIELLKRFLELQHEWLRDKIYEIGEKADDKQNCN